MEVAVCGGAQAGVEPKRSDAQSGDGGRRRHRVSCCGERKGRECVVVTRRMANVVERLPLGPFGAGRHKVS